MSSRHVDAIVIGAGQSGPSLAVRLAESGLQTLLVERATLGGTCVNNGCTPTKTLVASARAAHVVRQAGAFGIEIGAGPLRVDMAAVKARKDAVVKASVDGLDRWLRGTPNLSVVQGHARFVASHAIEVNGERIDAERIFLDVGARPAIPDWPGLGDVPYLDNVSMMALDRLPEHLVIVGGSYIGLEFAQMYRRFGSAVTVIEASGRLIGREDPEISAALQQLLERDGIAVVVGASNIRVGPDGGGVVVSFDAGGTPRAVAGSDLLVAVGRRPNTDDLGIEAAGIELDRHGYIVVDDQLQTRVPGVWALGDVNGRGAFTHTSYNDFEIVAANLLDGRARRVSERIPTYALYTDPPLGRCGVNEAQARATGRPTLVATMPMSRVGRARERGETTGFMKVLVDAETLQIVGAALFGIEADEAVQVLLLAMANRLTVRQVCDTMLIHPTVSELLPTLLAGLKPLV